MLVRKENQHEEITQIKNIKDCFENQNSIEDKTNNNKVFCLNGYWF